MAWYQPEQPYNQLPALPPLIKLETEVILKAALHANRYLAELKGYCQTLPNPTLLLNTVVLQESKDSSEIENIVTTQDELYKAILNPEDNSISREVISYREAVYIGLKELKNTPVFTGRLAIRIMQRIKNTTAGYRTLPGTTLINPAGQKVIYTPPAPEVIKDMMAAWEKFANANQELDPLITMALLHYQFEAIHPFGDGNGRTGRILNVLYLVYCELLTLPVLYHSAFIIQHKNEYYKKLRMVTEQGAWEDWILFMLAAVKETAVSTLKLIKSIIKLQEDTFEEVKGISQKLPAHQLNELIFSFPYVKIKTLVDKKIAKRQAASTYLQQLEEKKILKSVKQGREIYYINHRLMKLLTNSGN